MIGNWYSIINTGRHNLKIQLKISKNNTYKIDASVEPLPIPLNFTRVNKDNNSLIGYGKVFWNENEEFYVSLNFKENSFTGEMYVPGLGKMPLKGKPGN